MGQLKLDYFCIYVFISVWNTRQTQKLVILKLKKTVGQKLASQKLAKRLKSWQNRKKKKNVVKKLALKISQLPHFRIFDTFKKLLAERPL